jgi:hypothetical protein
VKIFKFLFFAFCFPLGFSFFLLKKNAYNLSILLDLNIKEKGKERKALKK